MREVDGLVYTEEEVKLDRLEKHIFVWKVDLEGGIGESNMHLEALLAERLMRESALLMQTLRSFAVPEGSDFVNGTDPVFRSEMGVAAKIVQSTAFGEGGVCAKEEDQGEDPREEKRGCMGRRVCGGGEQCQEDKEECVW
jgi:hypothetical protein